MSAMKVLLLAFLLIAPASLIAQSTGNDLVKICSEGDKAEGSLDNHFQAGVCAGFIMGASTMVDGLCGTKNATNGQMIKIVRKYLDDHPEELNQSAPVLIEKSMKKAFPCPASQ
jgi:hypothetical protein